jgi:hypothetical protein
MKGQQIVISAIPQGKFLEGTITDTSYPGMAMEVVPATTPIGGRFSYRHASRAAGTKGPVFILLEDDNQGGISTQQYQAGKRCRLYAPVMGEDLNLCLGEVSGTGTQHVTQGDLLEVDTDGRWMENSSGASAPFQVNETLTNQTFGSLVWCTYLGNQA